MGVDVKPAFPDHAPQYGALDTYRLAAEWLDGHGTVYDWGCGRQFAARFFKRSEYVGIDGTFGGALVDLATVQLECDSILMRHVLEHNVETWRDVLDNALRSFRRRMALVTFTPFAAETHVYKTEAHAGGELPYLRFRKADLVERMGSLLVEERAAQTTHAEHLFLLERR